MRILLFADIHIGSIHDTKYVYDTLTTTIDEELCFNKTDMVVILGDYFHKLFKANEDYISLSINIMSHLVRVCKREKTKIRIIYGTESHEMGQYHLFNHHLSSSGIDMKIVSTVTKEKIKGKSILYIPEEYIENKHEYYKEYFDSKYDYIFGHGVIIEGMSMVKYSENTKNTEKKVPHFKSKELSSISNICVFGHYHQFTDLEDNCYYLGSFFRDSFGEEVPKGYGVITDNEFKFIENKHAYVYKTYEFNHSDESLDHLMKEVGKIKQQHADIFSGEKTGKVRIVFNGIDDASFKDNVRNVLSNEKNIAVLIKKPEKVDAVIEEIKSDIDPEYDFILDESLNIEDKIYQYMIKTFDTDITLNTLKKYLN